MKTFNTVLSIILLIAVAYLFTREFGGTEDEKVKSSADGVSEALADGEFKNLSIAYINSDSLASNYDLRNELTEELETKAKVLEAELARMSDGFQQNVAAVEQKAASGASDQELMGYRAELQQNQQQLQMIAEGKQRQFGLEERRLDSLLVHDMKVIFNDVKEEYHFDYILTYGRGGSALVAANEALNITSLVLERLNTANSKKKEGATKEE